VTGAIERLQGMARRARAAAELAAPVDPIGAAILHDAAVDYDGAALKAAHAREKWIVYLRRGGRVATKGGRAA